VRWPANHKLDGRGGVRVTERPGWGRVCNDPNAVMRYDCHTTTPPSHARRPLCRCREWEMAPTSRNATPVSCAGSALTRTSTSGTRVPSCGTRAVTNRSGSLLCFTYRCTVNRRQRLSTDGGLVIQRSSGGDTHTADTEIRRSHLANKFRHARWGQGVVILPTPLSCK